jgi:hypothetical protein
MPWGRKGSEGTKGRHQLSPSLKHCDFLNLGEVHKGGRHREEQRSEDHIPHAQASCERVLLGDSDAREQKQLWIEWLAS